MKSEVAVTDAVKDLEPIFTKWVSLLGECSITFPQTRGAWYVECTLTSLLSSASWLARIPSIVEVKTDKHGAPGSRRGHADLAMFAPGGRVLAESKITWIPHPDDAERFENVLSDARREASCLPIEVGVRRLGLAFGVFEDQGVPVQELLSAVLRRMDSMPTRPDVLAWLEPVPAPGVVYSGCIVAGVLA